MTEPMMFGDYISFRVIRGRNLCLEGFNAILGPSKIGHNCLIGLGSVIGYPSRPKLLNFIKKKGKSRLDETFNIFELDEISEGTTIGNNCVIRGRAWIYEKTVLGSGIETGHNVMIRECVTVGNKTKIGTNTVIDGSISAEDGRIVIGDDVNIQSNVYIAAPVIIKNKVFIGPHVTFTNDRYPQSTLRSQIVVENGAIIGANSTLIAGITIGSNSMVAAASVVTKDVPEGWVVRGNPAQKHISIEEYNKKRAHHEKRLKS